VGSLQGLIGAFTETEKEMVAVERALEYTSVPDEDEEQAEGQGGSSSTDGGSPLHPAVEPPLHLAEEPLLHLGQQPAGNRPGCRECVSPRWRPTAGEVQFACVSVHYPGRDLPALADVTLRLAPGTAVGIAGRTGSGKSSLLAAICRLAPYTGRILVDGADLAEVPRRHLRRCMAVLPQAPLLLAGTVRSNLDPLGEVAGGDEQLLLVLLQCGLRREGENGPGASSGLGLEDPVQAGGANLSAGERQLLALARVLLRAGLSSGQASAAASNSSSSLGPSDVRLVCIDEAAASTDAVTEVRIADILRKAFPLATLLVVAHRLPTLLACDEVLVLDGGHVVQRGAPAALLQDADSAFALLISAASEGAANAEAAASSCGS